MQNIPQNLISLFSLRRRLGSLFRDPCISPIYVEPSDGLTYHPYMVRVLKTYGLV